MIPVQQTIFHDPANPGRLGNCLQAAIASMLALPLAEVPHFVQIDYDSDEQPPWESCLSAWLREQGWRTDIDVEPGEIYLGMGPSPRTVGVSHVALYRDGELVHDPHPDGTGVTLVSFRYTLRRCDPVPMSDALREVIRREDVGCCC